MPSNQHSKTQNDKLEALPLNHEELKTQDPSHDPQGVRLRLLSCHRQISGLGKPNQGESAADGAAAGTNL